MTPTTSPAVGPGGPRGGRGPRARRRLALVAVAALGLSLAAPAHAGEASDSAASWLGAQLVDGLVPGQSDGPPDLDLTLEVGLTAYGLGDTGLGDRVSGALLPRLDEVVRDGAGDRPTTLGGPTATFLRLVQAAGLPTDAAGEDLVATLERLVDDSGRLTDQVLGEAPDDDVEVVEAGSPVAVTSTHGQARAAAALADAGSPAAERALGYLLDQQCPGGGFRAASDAGDPACSSPEESDVATTARVVQQLAPLDLAPAALAAATDGLVADQRVDGSFVDGRWGVATTGLAAHALALQGRPAAASRAADHVRGLQVRAPGPCTAQDAGVVTGGTDDRQDVARTGVGGAATDTYVRTTAQVAPGLAAVSGPTRRLRAVADRSYVRSRTLQQIGVAHAAARDTVCLDRGGSARPSVTTVDGSTTFGVRTGRTTRSVAYHVTDSYGRTTRATLRVLGPTTLEVQAPRRVRRGATMTVQVDGLASGERATLVAARGQRVTAYANHTGRAILTDVPVLKKPGKRRYVVRGKFGRIRVGSDVVRVLRPRG